jgi:DNA-directed RNA polymerase delta subunit
MSEYLIDIPDEIMQQARTLAQQKQMSLNQFFASLITENSMQPVDNSLIQQRAKNADIVAFQSLLKKIPAHQTVIGDEIHSA